jgi:hypothetical protein
VLTLVTPTRIDAAVARLDAWLDTMRGAGGYSGPVAHWWQQSFTYAGTGLDWRYEGIIAGYLTLWERTGDLDWLMKARRAGDDLLGSQLPDGHYPASAFEMNPASAGTPHEAACDVGLLLLARALRHAGSGECDAYVACAARNIRMFYLDQLWDGEVKAFQDSPTVRCFVPNKAATVCDALFLLAELTADDTWVERFALPTLERIIQYQVRDAGPLRGAIAQNSFGARLVSKYFPIYIARCVPALLRGYSWTGDERYTESALNAMQFVARWCYEDGSCPTAVYPNLRVNRYPAWIAPLGDVLRAAAELRPYGFDADFDRVEQRLIEGQDLSGGVQTARGFAAQPGGSAGQVPDVRDLLHVAGWCDKAFRYLAAQAGPELPDGDSRPFEAACGFRGQSMWLRETAELLEISGRRGAYYRWWKGEPWPEVAQQEFWLR